LILLPILAFVGLVTDRVLQSGIEDYGYAQRIARLRGYYFEHAPELVDYLLSVPPTERLQVQGMHARRALAAISDRAGMVAPLSRVRRSPSPPWCG
jgi:hypothetical protein